MTDIEVQYPLDRHTNIPRSVFINRITNHDCREARAYHIGFVAALILAGQTTVIRVPASIADYVMAEIAHAGGMTTQFLISGQPNHRAISISWPN